MTDSDKRHTYALVVVGLLLIFAFCGWLFEAGSRHQSCYRVENPTYSEIQGDYKGQAEYAEVCTTDFEVFGDTIAQWLMAIFAIGATFVSLVAVFFLKDTLDASRDAVVAAIEANRISRESAERQLRAYVCLWSCGLKNFSIGEKPVFKITVRNTGQTPAHIIRHFTTVRTCQDPQNERVFWKNMKEYSVISLGPQQDTFQVNNNIPVLTNENYDSYVHELRNTLVAGVIIYKDAFGVTRRTIYRGKIDAQSIDGGKVGVKFFKNNNRAS